MVFPFSHLVFHINCSISPYRLEHPLQHAVPEHLRIDEKHFEEWRCEYDNWLATLTDLESEEEVPQMV